MWWAQAIRQKSAECSRKRIAAEEAEGRDRLAKTFAGVEPYQEAKLPEKHDLVVTFDLVNQCQCVGMVIRSHNSRSGLSLISYYSSKAERWFELANEPHNMRFLGRARLNWRTQVIALTKSLLLTKKTIELSNENCSVPNCKNSALKGKKLCCLHDYCYA